MAYSLVSFRRFQHSQIHLQYSLTIKHILLAHLQYRSRSWIEEFYRRRQNLFFCFQGNSLISSQLEIHIISCHLIEKEASESIFHLTTCHDSPIVIQQDGTSRTVSIEFESHVSRISALILNHEVEFLVAVLHSIEVKIEPFLSCSYRFTIPVEVNRLGTSIINNLSCFIYICGNSDLLV